MRFQKIMLLLLICITAGTTAFAGLPKNWPQPSGNAANPTPSFRADCPQGSSQVDQSINNVRARLMVCGDVWWDLNRARYVVPKVEFGSGLPEVSALFAGAVWLGGIDPGGNLKVAAQTYRSATRNDFWPGPLDTLGTTDEQTCKNWDKHWTVTAKDIETHLKNYKKAVAAGETYDCASIPEAVKGWPAKGNPYFFEINRFELPNTNQGLALFYDEDGDELYNPCNGDYPVIDIRGCPPVQYPDEMIFWIYNDNGGIHTQSQGSTPIQMEVQVQAFAYKTNNELNDMTFQRYKLINRAVEDIDSTFFAMWVDPDLGCPNDDYFGCDTLRELAICYNEDNLDGSSGCVCTDNIPTYCDQIPIIGIDYFRGPYDPEKPLIDPNTGQQAVDPWSGDLLYEEIGMSSFTYYVNGGWPGLPATSDPQTAAEYYNYLTGSWRNGESFTIGGNGFNSGGGDTKYAFLGEPNNSAEWSMASAGLAGVDGRTIQASGPFTLKPGAINELIIGLPIVFAQTYPNPSFDEIQAADDICQSLFDNCFDITDGPDAPDMDIIELDREIIVTLTNDTASLSNNIKEQYREKDLLAPIGEPDSMYEFEGYKIYQCIGPDVSAADITNNNLDKVRPVAVVDVKNGVANIYNWKGTEVPGVTGIVWEPTLKVEALDQGIKHTFRFTEDQFAQGNDRKLINHKKYYFTAIAYAYNGRNPIADANTISAENQREAYLEGRRNIGDGENIYYTVIPRPIVDRKLNTSYGEGNVYVTRLEGFGNMGNFLNMTDDMYDKILSGNFDGKVSYKPGGAPITVTIYNPLDVQDGEFILKFVDSNGSDEVIENNSLWVLEKDGETIFAEKDISSLNEQIIGKYGFSVSIQMPNEPGEDAFNNADNGSIGSDVEYLTEGSTPWLGGIVDGPNILDFIRTQSGEVDFALDPKQTLSTNSNQFVPYYLCRWDPAEAAIPAIITPSWQNGNQPANVRINNSLDKLNNVDIVFTSDKSKWSRCIVVESSPTYHTDPATGGMVTDGNAKNFDVRPVPSVGKYDNDGDGKPDPDNATDPLDGGVPMRGKAWFPGYAIDVETGKRLNIFFGEATVYNEAEFPTLFEFFPEDIDKSRDMLWNPTSTVQLNSSVLGQVDQFGILDFFLGGMQYVYVSNTEYDECEALRERLDPKFGTSPVRKFNALRTITWTSFPILPATAKMLPLGNGETGLIPADLVWKLRVKNKYQHEVTPSTINAGHPAYSFKIQGAQASALDEAGVENALDMINVVPNPYYGFSPYETSQFTNIVKITNLPAKCTVTIYTLDGKFIKQYNRDEKEVPNESANPGVTYRQILPDLEWDMKNSRGIPISSGVYLIHVTAPGLGERTLKWFGVNRQFDPSGL